MNFLVIIWVGGLKPYEKLSDEQKGAVSVGGRYACLPVHPTQLYSSGIAAVLCFLLYLFWRGSESCGRVKKGRRFLSKPGCTFGLMLIFYGGIRFYIEFLRDDNPIEFDGLTISQNIGAGLVVLGLVLIVIFETIKPGKKQQ